MVTSQTSKMKPFILIIFAALFSLMNFAIQPGIAHAEFLDDINVNAIESAKTTETAPAEAAAPAAAPAEAAAAPAAAPAEAAAPAAAPAEAAAAPAAAPAAVQEEQAALPAPELKDDGDIDLEEPGEPELAEDLTFTEDYHGRPAPAPLIPGPLTAKAYSSKIVSDCPERDRDTYIGGIIGGALMVGVGVAMGVPALVVEEKGDRWGKGNHTFKKEARIVFGAMGAASAVIGIVTIGIAGHKLHKLNQAESEISYYVAPTLGGATFQMTF